MGERMPERFSWRNYIEVFAYCGITEPTSTPSDNSSLHSRLQRLLHGEELSDGRQTSSEEGDSSDESGSDEDDSSDATPVTSDEDF
jgi:hypothetical protein